MKTRNLFLRLLGLSILVLTLCGVASAQIVSAVSGNWSAGATWIGGVVPGPTNNVLVDTAMTVTIDIPNAVCNDLTANGYVFFKEDSSGRGLTVNGNATVGPRGRLRSGAATPTAARIEYLTLNKNLTVALGGSFDMRIGTAATVSVGRVMFAGSTNSVINLSLTAYGSSVEEFNSVVINKSGTAKVILAAGNLYQNNNTTNSADTLVLINGIIETGTNQWVHLATSGASVQGASAKSYVNGILGRGLTNSGTFTTRSFEVGDSNGYRKITIRTTVAGLVTGHYLAVQVIAGNANTGSSTFSGGIDKVSAVRYYKVTYFPSTGSAYMGVNRYTPEYQAEDGVGTGNTDLRVARSLNNRAAWIGMTQTAADTTFTPDNAIAPDSLTTADSLVSTSTVYIALARATGTTTNTLVKTGTGVSRENLQPAAFELSQNFPNPFNPSTEFSFSIPVSQMVSVKVFDMLGKEVVTLVDGELNAGAYRATWNAANAASGVYYYRIQTPGFVQTRKMLLMK